MLPLLALTFLGLLCRQIDMAGLPRRASDHWKTFKEPLGFSRKTIPHATAISRAVAKSSLERLRDEFARWVVSIAEPLIKDRWWNEDRQWSTRPGLAERLAALRDMALAVLRLTPGLPEDLSIRGRADHLGRKPRQALKFMGALK